VTTHHQHWQYTIVDVAEEAVAEDYRLVKSFFTAAILPKDHGAAATSCFCDS